MPPAKDEVLSVSQLAARVRGLLEGEFAFVWVAGEVSSYTKASSGHMYFTLKDANAQLRCTFFRAANLRMRFDMKDGLQVLAHGRLSFYEPRGDAQFNVAEVQPKGVGAAELALRQLKEKLLARGFFDPRRKRPLPTFPKRVALIASATGAAIRDMVELFAQRWPLTQLLVVPSRVQGEGAAGELTAAVKALNAMHTRGLLKFDALVLGRGGGSTEDLVAFNDENLANAIFASVVPVVSAVGHETDVSVADLVADHRAETPSAAVVALTPNRKELSGEMLAIGERLGEAIDRRIALARQRLDQFASRPAFRRPLERIRDREQKLDDLEKRLRRGVQKRHSRDSERVTAIMARLETLSPLNVLKRGYSLTHEATGRKLILNAVEVQPGDVIVSRVANGEIVSRVEETRV